MQRAPIVSVVIPAFNHERFIDEAIGSVLQQTMKDLELLVVDDGSADTSAAKAQSWADSDRRVRVIRQSNGGSHAAINRGIEESAAPWVAILNSDDRWAPQRLERVLQEGRGGADFVVTGVRLIDEQGVEISDPDHWWLRDLQALHEAARTAGPVDGLLFGNYTVSTSNFFFSREVFRNAGPLRPFRLIPDWDWALRAARTKGVTTRFLMDEILLDYRLHGANKILSDQLRGIGEVRRLHRRLLAEYGIPEMLLASIQRNQRTARQVWMARRVREVEYHLRQREKDVAALQREVVLATGSAEELKGYVIEREADIRGLRAQIAALENSATELKGFVTAREADIRGLRAQIAALENSATELKGFVTAREADIRSLQAQIAALENSATELKGFVIEREADIRSLQVEKAGLERRLQENPSQRELLIRKDAELDALRAQVASLKHHAESVEGFVRDRERDVAQLQAELATQQRLIEEAESSRVWRLTRNLRRRVGLRRL